mmetsp:Transcript_32334/g.70578  ORF Transcript_32334/g.70578 Transcript_32334/m.70578 type:complete len:376 (-) Transcript_32334:225-1352(-)
MNTAHFRCSALALEAQGSLLEVAPADAVAAGEVVGADGPAGAVGVELGLHALRLEGVQEGREELPRRLQLVHPDEQPLVAVHHVQQQPLVRVRQVLVVPGLVGEVELGVVEAQAEAGHLVVDFEEDGLVRLNADHQLVRQHLRVHPALAVQLAGHVAELHADLRHALVERLARLHHERHPVPPGVVDEEGERGEGGAEGAGGHRRIVQVGGEGLAAGGAGLVLPHHQVVQRGHPHGPQHLHLLVADVLGVEANRGLHREQCQHLQQMVLHNVADDAVLVEVTPPALGAKGLGEGDLHVADVLARPEGLEQQVGEPQHRQVVDQLLPQVVVDPVDLILSQHLEKVLGELLARLCVPPEGLLDDHPCVTLLARCCKG